LDYCSFLSDKLLEQLIALPFFFYVLKLRVLLDILLNKQGEL